MSACKRPKPEVPEELLSQEKMTHVLIDVHLVEAQRTNLNILFDTLSASDYYKKVYEKHGIDGESFKKNIDFYSRNPTLMLEVYKAVIDSLESWEKASY